MSLNKQIHKVFIDQLPGQSIAALRRKLARIKSDEFDLRKFETLEGIKHYHNDELDTFLGPRYPGQFLIH